MPRVFFALALAGISYVVVCIPSTTYAADKPLPVQVVNPGPIAVRDADNPARQPVTDVIYSGRDSRSYTVPSGKRLVIEYLSGTAFIRGTGNHLTRAIIVTESGGFGWSHSLPLTLALDTGDSKSYVFAGLTRLYSEEGSEVTASYSTTDTSAELGVSMTFTGYLIDLL